MPKYEMVVDFPQLDVKVKAELLDTLAPNTCEWVWETLKEPVKNEIWHVQFLGRGVTCRHTLPHPERPLPKENLTITPAAGDILIVNFTEESGRSRGLVAGERPYERNPPAGPGKYTGFDLFYGPDSRMLIPMGFHAACNFARINENLDKLAEVAHITRLEGVKDVVFSRA